MRSQVRVCVSGMMVGQDCHLLRHGESHIGVAVSGGSNELWAGIDVAFILCFGCVDVGTVNEFGQAFTLHSFHVAACSCNILAPAVGEDATRLQEEIPSRWRRSQGEAARACAEEKPWGPGKRLKPSVEKLPPAQCR